MTGRCAGTFGARAYLAYNILFPGPEPMLCAVRCELTYDVTTTTDLILNIEAQRSGRQHILNEHFSMSPQTATAIHEMPGKRQSLSACPAGAGSARHPL